jgi:serine/threonine-protein kinase HipA
MSDDPFDDPRMEAVCLSLARACGIEVPDHKLTKAGRHSVLLMRWFDRHNDGNKKSRYISAATLLREDPNEYRTGYSYANLAVRARKVGMAPCGKELFARLLFNCFIHNTDDHLRNTAFIGDANGWRLSPAFDLVPQKQEVLVMAPARGISSLPTPASAFDAWPHMHLELDEAREIYNTVVEGLKSLDRLLDQYNVSLRDRSATRDLMATRWNPPALN